MEFVHFMIKSFSKLNYHLTFQKDVCLNFLGMNFDNKFKKKTRQKQIKTQIGVRLLRGNYNILISIKNISFPRENEFLLPLKSIFENAKSHLNYFLIPDKYG